MKSQNKIQDPAKLYKFIALINAEQWVLMGVKDKGDIYEGLLEKNAEDTRRLALMNLFVHNIGDIDSNTIISPNDSLIASPETRYILCAG